VDARERITTALKIIDLLDAQLAEIEHGLRALARHQTGCQALMTQYGMGEISALVTLCELGDITGLHASRHAVKMAGIEIGVHRSDRHAQLGKLTRQGSAPLRWALYEAAQSASHRGSPDYHDYHALKARGLSHTRASLTIARKLARRSYHILRALGPAALEPTHQRPALRESPPITDTPTCGQLPQRSRYPPPTWRPTKDRAAAVAPPERPINHHFTGRERSRPRAQIRQGVHGAQPIRTSSTGHPRPVDDPLTQRHPHHHKHTHQEALDIPNPAQISNRAVTRHRSHESERATCNWR
jgi:hypothetical protein